MKELCKRFNVTYDLEKAQEIFLNKIQNIFFSSSVFTRGPLEDKFDLKDLSWDFCNYFGYIYGNDYYIENNFESDTFEETLMHLQWIVETLFEDSKTREQYNLIVGVIKDAIDSSPHDLGIRIIKPKNKSVKIVFSGSELLDSRMVDDVLGVLDGKEKSPIRQAFDKGLKEFLEAKRDRSKLKNCVRDMQLSLDETIKHLFKDKNLGLKHLFKDDRWKKVDLNEYQKQIYWNLNEYIDKKVKHKANEPIEYEDAENIIYLTGMFIRHVMLKKERKR